jgi:hypothetical protein
MVTLVMLSAFAPAAPDADVPAAVLLELELEHAAARRAAGMSSIAGKSCLRRRRPIGLDFI